MCKKKKETVTGNLNTFSCRKQAKEKLLKRRNNDHDNVDIANEMEKEKDDKKFKKK